jgi:hypothetical protein
MRKPIYSRRPKHNSPYLQNLVEFQLLKCVGFGSILKKVVFIAGTGL